MPGMPYDQLANAPSVKDDPMSTGDESAEPKSVEDEETKGLPPELKALGKEMGLSPQQSAALKEFVAACMMHESEPDPGDGDQGY